MIKKIFCPVDFSDEAINVAKYANELSILLDAKLILVHKKNLMAVTHGSTPDHYGNLVTSVEKLAKDQMTQLLTILSQRNNPDNIHAFLKYGLNTEQELLKSIKDHKPDLIVMHTEGLTGMGSFLTGTKTDKLINKVAVPILIIPKGYTFQPINCITYSTDNQSEEKDNLKFVSELGQTIRAHIYVIHIAESIKDSEISMKKINKECHDHISCEIIVNNNLLKGIQQFSKSKSCEIIVMSTSSKSFFERIFSFSQTKTMSYNMETPLLILRKSK